MNALVPATSAMTISSQRRDVRQRGIDLDIAVTAPGAKAPWVAVPAVTLAALVVFRRRRC